MRQLQDRHSRGKNLRSESKRTQMAFMRDTKGMLKMVGKEARIQIQERKGTEKKTDQDPDQDKSRNNPEKKTTTLATTRSFWVNSTIKWEM